MRIELRGDYCSVKARIKTGCSGLKDDEMLWGEWEFKACFYSSFIFLMETCGLLFL